MAKFIITQKKKDEFVFNLVASNGTVLGTSKIYRSVKSAQNGIESVRFNRNAPMEDQTVADIQVSSCPKWELYEGERGEFRFRLKAMNGDITLSSEEYVTKANAKKAIESIRKSLEEAPVEIKDKK